LGRSIAATGVWGAAGCKQEGAVIPSQENALLAALPRIERERIERHCVPVQLRQGEVLSAPGDDLARVWFPAGALIAQLTEGGDHDTLAVGLIGNEGMLGASLVLGGRSAPVRALVQSGGAALRMEADALRRALHDVPRLEGQLRLYLEAELRQFAQVAVCAAFHVVVMRVAYWLLLTHDRAQGDRFYLTHDLLAHLLGVRRSGVTAAAGTLQQRGLISYTRGRLLVLDRKGLEQACCRCYEVSRDALRPLQPDAAGALHHPGDEIGARRIARASEPRHGGDAPAVPRTAGARR
jgi:CRP-like cAMP-binding protein